MEVATDRRVEELEDALKHTCLCQSERLMSMFAVERV